MLHKLASFFDKQLKVIGFKSKVAIHAGTCGDKADTAIPNQKLADKIHKPIIRKLEKMNYIHLLCMTFGVFN